MHISLNLNTRIQEYEDSGLFQGFWSPADITSSQALIFFFAVPALPAAVQP